MNIAGSLLGAQRLQEIQPSGLAKITAAYSRTLLDGDTCPGGELLQGSDCGKFITFLLHNNDIACPFP